jgi:LysR family transcriptional regulator (chromosome initiation inhibitor)
MLDYKLIEAYAAVLKEGGFEKAAQKLHITQSAVSQRIKQLEEQFGQIVLLRSSPPQSTEFGKKVMGLYNQVSRLEDDLHNSLDGGEKTGFTSLPIGINADTLATWFFKAVQPFLTKNRVVLDLMVEDQDQTHSFLKDGKVLGCISTRASAIQGCRVEYLGDIEYSLYCSSDFSKRWFPQGLEITAVQHAPMITFNRKDELNKKILKKAFGRLPKNYSTFYVPSTELFLEFIQNGLAYGAMPYQQSRRPLKDKLIIELSPEVRVKVSLYWHCWNLDSELLRQFSDQVVRGFKDTDLDHFQ